MIVDMSKAISREQDMM